MKTDLIVLKTRSLKNYRHFEFQSAHICDWLSKIERIGPSFAHEIEKGIKLFSPHLELIIHE